MRRLTLTIASILAATLVTVGLQTAPPQEGTDTIVGAVTRADTGAVLHGARLELVRADYQRLSTGYEKPCKPEPKRESSESRRFAATDDKGKFTFTGIVPGEYYLYAENEGFLKFAYGQRGGFRLIQRLIQGRAPNSRDMFPSLRRKGQTRDVTKAT